jgi:integrase
MRIKNLAALELDRHVLPFGRGAGLRYKINVPGAEVKNGVSIAAELQGDASRILTLYLRQYRHLLVGEPTNAVFPSAQGGPRGSHSLGYGISNIISKETGLKVHPHLFRHLAAKLYLETYHGDYETVRRQLGHKKHDTTVKFYAPFDNKRAQERFSQVVLEARKPRERRK